MGAEFYESINRYFLSRPSLARALCLINTGVTGAVFLSYPALLIWLLANGQSVFKFILIPGAAFCILSIFRKLYNAPRPYEVYDVTPLNKKDTRGKSFPSRHVFSCYVIAMSFAAAHLPIPTALVMLAANLLFILRVCLGVHFVRDVLVGAALGLLSGGLMLFI